MKKKKKTTLKINCEILLFKQEKLTVFIARKVISSAHNRNLGFVICYNHPWWKRKKLLISASSSVKFGYDILRLFSIREQDLLAILSLDSLFHIVFLSILSSAWIKKSLSLHGSNPVPTEECRTKLNNVSRISHKPSETSFQGLKKLVTGLYWKAKQKCQERWANKSLLNAPNGCESFNLVILFSMYSLNQVGIGH